MIAPFQIERSKPQVPWVPEEFFFSRSERTLSDSKSTVAGRKKKNASGRTTPEPRFRVIKLGQNLSQFADWTLRSREFLIGPIEKPVLNSCCDKQRCVTSAREEKPNCFNGPCAASVPSRTITALIT